MVKLRNLPTEKFHSRVCESDVVFVCFGAGAQSLRFFENNCGIGAKLMCFVDNDSKKQGSYVVIAGDKKRIISFAELAKIARENKRLIILITSLYAAEILEQLDNCPDFNGIEAYLIMLIEKVGKREFSFTKGELLIPKKIHYCWFGKNAIPAQFQDYIEGWKRICPDYEIIRHDESNYDITKNAYMKEAYESKKWGFVPDFARMDIVYNEGGVYLDTDVEMIRKPGELLCDNFFCSFQDMSEINFGNGFGAVKNHPLLKELLDVYNDKHFIRADGTPDLTVCTFYQEPVFKRHGFNLNGLYQNIDGAVIYPEEVFSALNLWSGETEITDKTIAVHHYTSTWAGKELKLALGKMRANYRDYEQRIRE